MKNRPVSLLEWAYGEIRDKLYSGKFAPGQKLVVSQLADDLSISPTPVKEAMNRLVSEGQLEKLPHRGFIVRQITSKEINDVMNCRMMMELFSVPSAIRNLPHYPKIQKEMHEAMLSLDLAGQHDFMQETRLEEIFHGSLIRLTGNTMLCNLYDRVYGVGIAPYVYASGNHPAALHTQPLKEHHIIYDSLVKGDSETLSRTLREHLERTTLRYQKYPPSGQLHRH